MIFSFQLMLWIAPAMILGLWAQARVRSTFAQGQKISAGLSGAAAARHILDAAGLHDVGIEPVPGQLSDHYDPRDKVLRLSQPVYNSRSAAAVGIAAHEAGHALQDAKQYAPLVVRNLAVPAAQFGGSTSTIFIFAGLAMGLQQMLLIGIIGFACMVGFQLINLPVEFDASNRAKRLLTEYGIVPQQDMVYVNKMLNAAAWTYVAATLQAVITLVWYVMQYAGSSND